MNPWRLCARMLSNSRGALMVYLVSLTVSALVALAPGILQQRLFDYLANGTPDRFPWFLLVAFFNVQFVPHIIAYLELWLMIGIQHALGAKLRVRLLQAIFSAQQGSLRNVSTGEALNYFREDVEEAMQFVAYPIRVAAQVVATVAGIWIMLTISVRVTLVALLPFVAAVAIAALANRGVGRLRVRSRKETAGLSGFLGDIFRSVQAIKVAGAEIHISKQLQIVNEARRTAMLKDTVAERMLKGLYYNMGGLGIAVVLIAASSGLRDGTFSVGDFALFQMYLMRLSWLHVIAGELINRSRRARVALTRIQSFAQLPDEIPESSPCGQVVQLHPRQSIPEHGMLDKIIVSELTASYKPSGKGINRISFELNRGELLVIAGRTASGKSTLVKALLGLLPIDAGAVHWNGMQVSDRGAIFVPPRCAYTPQVPSLFSSTIRDNLLLGCPEEGERLSRSIRDAVMESEIHDMSEMFDTIVGPSGLRLSGGQRQRLAVARMLYQESLLIVCDDISSALDIHTETKLWEGIRENKQRACLVVSNRPSVIMMADRVVVLHDGRSDYVGSPRDAARSSRELIELLNVSVGTDFQET